MGCDESNKSRLVLTLVFLLASLNLIQLHCLHVHGAPQVPCFYIFGDSLSDNGNNNDLQTAAKSNYNPYGIDFPSGRPTGRFTNGKTSVDIISQHLGFPEFIPPYANHVGRDILRGLNYASGAAGILDDSGIQLGTTISLGIQTARHIDTVSRIAEKLGGYENARKYLNKCLYYVNIGSNDYINNYFLPDFYPTSRIYTPQEYANRLINDLSFYLQELQDVGARKFVLVGLGYIGCTPQAITNGTCDNDMNAAALLFNANLKNLVVQLNNNSSSQSKFIFVDTTAGSPLDQSRGFTVVNAECCPSGANGQCIAGKVPCQNRNQYVFYDKFHTSEAANKIVADETYDSSSNPHYTFPMDIKSFVSS